MFNGCSSLEYLELSPKFKTKGIYYMSNLFKDCSSLKSLDLSSFNTSNTKYMDLAFYNCTSLTSLEISTFSTTRANSISQMFYLCTSLTSLYLPLFDTREIADYGIDSVFYGCTNLTLTIHKNNCSNLLAKTPDYVNVIDIQ